MEETGEAYAGGAVVVTPRLVIAVYAAGVVRKGQSACGVVERIEIIVRIYGDSGHCLHGVFKPEAVAEEQVGDMPDHRARQRMSVCAEIGHGRVAVEDFAIERQPGGRAYAESRVYADTDRALFPAHERAAGYDVVKRGYYLDIGVEIHAPFAIEDVKPRIVAHKGPFAPWGGLAGVEYGVEVIVWLVPLLDFPSREVSAPRLYASARTPGQRIPAKPAVMYGVVVKWHYFNESLRRNFRSGAVWLTVYLLKGRRDRAETVI